MGYRIDYQPIKKVRRLEERSSRLLAMTALMLLCYLLLVNLFWPQGAAILRGLLFSGDISLTVSALESFAQDLQMGEGLYLALEDFCRRILFGVNLG